MSAESKPTAQPSYRATVKLPSTFVTKNLLKSMEAYLLKRPEAVLPPGAELTEMEYKVAIVDAFGTETLGTIDDFGPSRFADATSKILMKLSVRCKPRRNGA